MALVSEIQNLVLNRLPQEESRARRLIRPSGALGRVLRGGPLFPGKPGRSIRPPKGVGILFDYDAVVFQLTDPRSSNSTNLLGVSLAIEGQITDTKTPNYNNIDILGRSAPLVGYANSGARTLSFTGILQQETIKTKEEVWDRVNFLKSFVYPDYTSGRVANGNLPSIRPPHRVRFIYGQSIAITGIITACDVTWNTTVDGRQVGVKLDVETAQRVPRRDETVIDDTAGAHGHITRASVGITIQEIREFDVLDVYDMRSDKADYEPHEPRRTTREPV